VRILHVVPTYLPATRYGGPIHAVHGLCRALTARGHQVEVFTTNVDGDHESAVPLGERVELDSVGVTYFPSRFRRTYWSPAMKARLSSQMKSFDLLHVHSVFLHPTLAASRAALRSRVPYVVSPRGMLVEDLINAKSSLVKRAWISLFERHTIESASAVHLTSDVEARELDTLGFRIRRAVVIPNGIDLEQRAARTNDRARYILFLGRLNWKKRPSVLIEALRELPDEWSAVFAGPSDPGMNKELRSLADRLGVSERVEFTGEIEGDTKRQLIAGAALLVLPSISENFGNVVLEAAIESVPSALTRGVGVAPRFEREHAAFILEEPISSFGAQIHRFALSGERASAGLRARRLVEQEYGWRSVAATMEAMYLEIVENHRQ